MTNQNYLVIENDVVINLVIWDGNTDAWTPPQGSTMLVQATTPALVWVLNSTKDTYELKESMGVGGIGFTWNGVILTTNQEAPPLPLFITPETLPDAQVNQTYSTLINGMNGIAPYSYNIMKGMPQGLAIANNEIFGKPIVAGVYTIMVEIRDSNGSMNYCNISLTIA